MLEYIVCTNIISDNNIRFTEVEDVRQMLKRIYKAFNKTSLTCPCEGVYTEEEIEEKIANACGWCEMADENSPIYEGECFTIKVREKPRTFYTLRTGNGEDIYSIMQGMPIEFPSFELAYREMINLYASSMDAGKKPRLYGIWKTTVYDGNTMVKPVWS